MARPERIEQQETIMAIAVVTQVRALPGKGADFRDAMERGRAISERLGVNGRRLQPIAGGVPGSTSIVNEFDDLAAYGAYLDTRNADSEWQAFVAEIQGNQIMEILQTTVLNEV